MAFLGGLFGRTSSGLSKKAQALLDQYESQSREASATQEGYLQHAGESNAADIQRQFGEDRGTLQASLAARGLGNTSIYDSLAARSREGEMRALSSNAENIATARAGYVYRPDASLAGYAMQAANTPRHTAGPLSGLGSLAGAAVGTMIAPGVGTALGAMAGGALEGGVSGQGVGQGGYEGLGYGATAAPFAQKAFGTPPPPEPGAAPASTTAANPAAGRSAWESMAPMPTPAGYYGTDAGRSITGAPAAYDPYADLRNRRRNARGGSTPTSPY